MNSKKSLVFAGTNENGFQIINVNKINLPKIVYSKKYEDSTTGIYLYSDDIIFISNGNSTFEVIRVT